MFNVFFIYRHIIGALPWLVVTSTCHGRQGKNTGKWTLACGGSERGYEQERPFRDLEEHRMRNGWRPGGGRGSGKS